MRGPLAPFAVLLAASLLLAGCMSDDPAPPPSGKQKGDTKEAPPVDTGSPLDDASATGDASDPGSRAHRHDYWGGKTEVVLLDGTYPLDFFCAEDALVFHFGCVIIGMGNGSVVYQGTSRLTLAATWDDPTLTGLAFRYRDAAAMHDELTPLQSGVSVEIPVTAATADIPHSKESKWEFQLMATSAAGTGYGIGVPVKLVVTIYRGLDLPLDPPHPNFWGDKAELPLATVNGTLKKPEFDAVAFHREMDRITLPPPAIVPPGTDRLLVQYTWTVRDPQPGVDYHLYPVYKTARDTTWQDDRDAKDLGAGKGEYVVMVDPDMTDSPYATESAWAFSFIQYHSVAGTPATAGGLLTSAWQREIDYTVTVTAFRDVTPTGTE